LLAAPVAFEQSLAVGKLIDSIDLAELERRFQDMEREAEALLPEGNETLYERSLDMRHSGQDAPLEIAIERPFSGGDPRELWAARFFELYQELYGRVDDDNPIEIANVRVRVARPSEPPSIKPPRADREQGAAGHRAVFVATSGAVENVPVYKRTSLAVGQRITGPAIIEERESTTVLGTGDIATVDRWACLQIDVELSRTSALERGRAKASVL
jgi:N-methylhydantoinase A/oxoprolinase/acetone carboxylase beta subunit